MEYPYVIIDQDPKSVSTIQLVFENYSNFACVGIASTEEHGLDLILERMPALVFLNIEMAGSQAQKTLFHLIDVLRNYMTKLPEFVVMASTPDYAVEAIRNGVLDYILRPSDFRLLRRTILRFQKESSFRQDNTLCFKSYGDYRFINADEVLYLKADSNTTDFVMANGSTVGAYKSLKYFQESLPKHFVRIHNSYIVNTNYISRIHFGKSRCDVQNSNSSIPFSKSYRENVEFIKNLLSNKSFISV